MAGSLVLVANPGSASRKYALFEAERLRAEIHFEFEYQKLVCTFHQGQNRRVVRLNFQDMTAAPGHVVEILRANGALEDDETISKIGLRVVAPSSYFLEDHIIDDEVIARLEEIRTRAPIHITATLEELYTLRKQFPDTVIVGVSDSAFHATKPDFAWNYGISLDIADHFEIKRFGYHGLSAASVIDELIKAEKLPPKIIVCHLGSGASVTAVKHGKSMDNSMGYSPLEGVVMSTRSGSIDPAAVHYLKVICQFNDDTVDTFLNNHSGLQGLGGSSDIRELLKREATGDNRARLALATYIYSVQKAVGQMAAVLNGADALVFTGTVGERSAAVRQRVTEALHYLDFVMDDKANEDCDAPEHITTINQLARSKPIFAIPTQEATEIARRVHSLAS